MTSEKRTSLKTGDAKGVLQIVRPSELAKNGVTGVVARGTYEGSKPNKFNTGKKDYFIRGDNDTLYILNDTKSLSEQLGQLEAGAGTVVEVIYNGKVATKNGKGFHDFETFVIG